MVRSSPSSSLAVSKYYPGLLLLKGAKNDIKAKSQLSRIGFSVKEVLYPAYHLTRFDNEGNFAGENRIN
jgi:hypothetical protein